VPGEADRGERELGDFRENPKSEIRREKFSEINRFSGFMSK
jgi:hypothetical protein